MTHTGLSAEQEHRRQQLDPHARRLEDQGKEASREADKIMIGLSSGGLVLLISLAGRGLEFYSLYVMAWVGFSTCVAVVLASLFLERQSIAVSIDEVSSAIATGERGPGRDGGRWRDAVVWSNRLAYCSLLFGTGALALFVALNGEAVLRSFTAD